MTLDQKLIIYKAVIVALRSESNLPQSLKQFSLEEQIEAIRFMEFIADETEVSSPKVLN